MPETLSKRNIPGNVLLKLFFQFIKNMPAKTLLSIVILNYNSGDYLEKCLLSLKEKTRPSFLKQTQIIVVDNASTDQSLSLAQKTTQKENLKVLYLPLRKNFGFSKGNNKAIPHLTGKYTLFLNPDIILFKNSLSCSVLIFYQKVAWLGGESGITCIINGFAFFVRSKI